MFGNDSNDVKHIHARIHFCMQTQKYIRNLVHSIKIHTRFKPKSIKVKRSVRFNMKVEIFIVLCVVVFVHSFKFGIEYRRNTVVSVYGSYSCVLGHIAGNDGPLMTTDQIFGDFRQVKREGREAARKSEEERQAREKVFNGGIIDQAIKELKFIKEDLSNVDHLPFEPFEEILRKFEVFPEFYQYLKKRYHQFLDLVYAGKVKEAIKLLMELQGELMCVNDIYRVEIPKLTKDALAAPYVPNAELKLDENISKIDILRIKRASGMETFLAHAQ